MKRLIVDLDGTLTLEPDNVDYRDKKPRLEVVRQLRKYKDDGFEIVIATSRNMRTYAGSVGKINVNTLPIIIEWLSEHDIPFDEIYVGKPWCGHEGFYIDDKAIRPSEFAELTYEEIQALLQNEAVQR